MKKLFLPIALILFSAFFNPKDYYTKEKSTADFFGILRTDLTQQYVILARNCPQLSYQTIKKYVFNSIKFSFLEDRLKAELTEKLKSKFTEFETFIAGI